MKKKRQKQKTDMPAVSPSAELAREHAEPTVPPSKRAPAQLAGDESPEPKVSGNVPLPMMVVFLLGLLVYVADMYLMNNSGAFHARVYYPLKEMPIAANDLKAKGKQIFNNNCAACHQSTGAGNRALNFPPLAGSDWVLAEGPNRIIRIVLNGLNGPIEVNGEQYSNNMLPWKDTMSDDDIAAVLTYVRNSWGNEASEVAPEQVKAVRDATSGRASNWTAAELLKVPVSD